MLSNETQENETIQGQIAAAAPDFRPEHALLALHNTNVYLFRYFPKQKMIVLTERICHDFQVHPVYHNMPDSFAEDFVAEENHEIFKKLYHDIDAGIPSATINFRAKSKLTWCRVTLTTVEWDAGHKPQLCTGVVEDCSAEELAQAELNSILSSISCGILQYRKSDNKLLRANKAALDILGYDSMEELIDGRDNGIALTVLPEDRKYIRELADSLNTPGDIRTIEYRVKHKSSDQLRYCFGTVQVYDDIRGDRIIQRSIMDITDRKLCADIQQTNDELTAKQKEMFATLRAERKQYRDALVAGSEYSYRFDVTDGMVYSDFDYSVCGGLQEKLGLSTPVRFDDMIQRWLEVTDPVFLTPDEQNPITAAGVMTCYKRGMKHIATDFFNTENQKYYRRTFLLSESEDTGHLCAIVIVTDITSIIREETRKQNKLTLINRDLQNQIGISKAFSSFYFATWDINLVTGQMLHISAPDWALTVEQETDGDFQRAAEIMIETYVKEESREVIRNFANLGDMAERLKGENILSCEYQGVHFGWSTACLIPFMRDEDGNVLRAIFALREISKEKRIEAEAKQALEEAYEAANRANAAKTDFLSSVSHDIRTPMNGIIGMTAIAGTHLDDKERVADCLAKISISSKHLLGLINEVLDMNKIESGKLDLNAEEFNLSDLMDTLLTMEKPQIEAKNHTLSVNIQNIEHENVVGDSLRIQQVFTNLLSNSVKYTPPGGTIRISLSEKATNTPKIGCYEFIVEDNGIGMSEEFQKHLFEPFSRAKDQRVEKLQGSGLGMPIARNIIRMMNGDIQVESELSKGTKFIVTMYLELQETDDSVAIGDFLDLPILVADDDKIACQSTCQILDELGMKGEWVLTGEEAVAKTVARHEDGNDYFAVILDWKMPTMDGLEATKQIRQAVGNDVPIIIISAYDWSDIEQEARAAGANAFISKPLFKSRVAYLFRSLLGKAADREALNGNGMAELSQKDFTGRRALLAEDNELNAEIAGELLGMTGLTIEYAKTGKEAVDLVIEHPENYYDIIFIDIQMPDMDGYEATRAIRSLPGEYEKLVPIIAMTANAFATDVQSAKNAGMNEHIAKPLNIPQLVKALNRWLV